MAKPPHIKRDAFDRGARGMQPQALRRANERSVLTVIAFTPGLSNAEISRQSGLAPQTVSAILSDCETAGLIQRGPLLRGRRGQPATPIYLHPEGAYSIGVEVGPRQAQLLLINLHAQIQAQERLAYDSPAPSTLVPALAAAVERMVAVIPDWQRSRLADIGLALPSRLLAEFDAAADLSKATGLDVLLEDCGSTAAWAHVVDFEPPRPARFSHLFIGRSISAGLVSEGLPWQGPLGAAADLGAMLVPDGSGGQVRADSLASLEPLGRRMGYPDDLPTTEWDFDAMGPLLDDWLNTAALTLANVVYNTTTVVGAPLFVLDGALPADVRERLRQRIETAIAALPVEGGPDVHLVAGRLGATAIALGAAELPLYRRYFSRDLADVVG